MRKVSTYVFTLLVVSTAFLVSGTASAATQFTPSSFETFAVRPTAITWSKFIGHIESPQARITVTALVVQDPAMRVSVMRGLRLDLEHTIAPNCDWKYTAWRIMWARSNAAVYVEEGQIESVRKAIEHGAALPRPCDQISPYETTAFSGRESTGLIICGYRFAGTQPSELAELFTRAIEELKSAAR